MHRMNTMDFLKGVGAGMAAGAAIGMLVSPRQKKCKTGLSRALHSAGEIIDGLSCAMGL
ncbi:MAG: hypothetical protein IJC35_04455 [Oscillospiraceae bacterium]|nr:hypothetical protein [Oscillospiraceae bacterium]